jgi:predicted transcriptional regulator
MLIKSLYFKPTALYKEFLILDLIEKDSKITQRMMSQAIGVAVSTINEYLDEYEELGLIKRKYLSTKTVEYFITKKGRERKKVLNIGYLNSAQILYNSAKENIEKFLIQIEQKGYKNILLYGAGEVAEMMLHTLKTSLVISINAQAIIDDDVTKVGSKLVDVPIISRAQVPNYPHDGILISSYSNKNSIKNKLITMKYPEKNIIEFFE